MGSADEFTGLTMPVFTAFGWAGEEAAINFAFTQLEEFIHRLHNKLPPSVKDELPEAGVSRESHGVYLATGEDVERDGHVAFYARPMSLEVQLAITDKEVLQTGLKRAEKEPERCHQVIARLEGGWNVHVQQMELDEDTEERSSYQDLFKDSVSAWDLETAVAISSKAAYLNGQEQWVTPLYLSYRVPSEQVAAMGLQVVDVMHDHVSELMPAFFFFTGRKAPKAVKSKPVLKPAASSEVPQAIAEAEPEEEFVYVAELQPLHIRRGFINMTPEHWPFFAESARATIRDVTVHFDKDKRDPESKVWRLQPHDQARLVLGTAARMWMEEHFSPNDKIELRVQRLDDEEIQISMTPGE